ncbi:MAG TPA: ABC transporter substrate-binding protein [Ideonella sp.]|uniref:ABC transporter substrate-binding protein n=1 Tax=Ideonella sp. TaxID=1929293 RepID=UPI002E365338|nr:ABC transporter substrate-binding protein [Ideonella sp.]HEX5682485.1 ABC transporter substrate-binding protein [Ideonella sp.]
MILRRTTVVVAALAALLSIAGPAAAQAQAPDWKKVRIAVEGAYPPFSEVGTDGKIKGFDIDIANALCTEMKAECTLVSQEWDGMIPALQARKFDAIVAQMSITEERQKSVLFTNKYSNTPAWLVAKTGTPADQSAAAWKGKKIAVQRTTTHDRFATQHFKDSEIVRYAKQDEVFLDLAAGRVDAVLCDSVAADLGFMKTPAGKGFARVGAPIDDPKIFGIGAGIAVRKGDTALQQKLNAAIAAIRANGTYKKIQDKYFAFDVYGQ